jgi:HEAT repeat protein
LTDQPNSPLNMDDLINQLLNGVEGNPEAQWQAAIALGDVTAEAERTQAVNALAQVYANAQSHALVRTHAVESLSRLGEATALPTLRQALTDNYRLVRAYAMPGYAALADATEVIDTLTPIAESDPFFGVRAEAFGSMSIKAAGQTDVALRQRVVDFLNTQRAIELAQAGTGTERIIAEIDRGLARLGI